MDNNDVQLMEIGHKEINKFGETYYSNLNPVTFYTFSATELFDKSFAHSLLQPNQLHIILGSDSGLLPHYLIQKGLPEGARYVFIEPQTILNELKIVNALPQSDMIAYADELNWFETLTEFKINDYFFSESVSFEKALCAKNNTIPIYAQMYWQIDEELKQIHYQATVAISSEPFITQQILNCAFSDKPAILFNDAFKGKTAFVLGGGPSLDDVLPWLQENRHKVVIFAVSRIVRRLIDVNIEPDFVVSVDPQVHNVGVSKDIFSLSTKPILLYSYHLYTNLVSQWQGRSCYLGDRVPWQSSINCLNIASVGPTVTNIAINTVAQLGFEQLFLAGVDFCYTVEGFTHAKGSLEHEAGARFSLSGIELETYSGVMAPTGLDYAYARNDLEEHLDVLLAQNAIKIFNTSLNAAKIRGIAHHAINNIAIKQNTAATELIIDQCFNNYKEPHFIQNIEQDVNKTIYQLKEIQQIAQEAIHCNNKMYSSQGYIDDIDAKRKLEKLEKKLQKKHKNLTKLVQLFGIRNFLKMTKPYESELDDAKEVKERLTIYYHSFVDGSHRLKQLLEHAQKRIHARAEEFKANPDWKLIISTAQSEGYSGRVHFWKNFASVEALTKYRHEFSAIEILFQQTLLKQHQASTNIINKRTDLGIITTRAVQLFNQKNKEALKRLLLSLMKHKKQASIQPYRHLVLGYIAELENNKNQALLEYQRVIDSSEGPLHEALLGIVLVDFDIGSGELAHQALECLAQINVKYLSMYGDSCRIRGLIKEAINAYLTYLNYFPNDRLVQLTLTQLYLDQKIYEGVELMLNHILQSDPNNKNALYMQKRLHQEIEANK